MNRVEENKGLAKSPTGIAGFDSISDGGLPKGRPTLLCGAAGTGKTLFGIEFLVHGIEQFHEPGLLISFDEKPENMALNVASLGFQLDRLQQEGTLKMLRIDLDPRTFEETGQYDLEPLFLRFGAAIDAIGAKRVLLDSIDNFFSAFTDQATLRSEFKRMMHWLQGRGLTAIVTAERGDGSLTRHGIEEYIADCVVELNSRIAQQTYSRLIHIAKFRGSSHCTDEVPFLITKTGIVCMPLNELKLNYQVSSELISTGINTLDEMLGGGLYRGSSLLISGNPGSGKSTLAAQLAHASCQRGERTLYVAYEEPPAQIMRNMKSAGIDLQPWADSGVLQFMAYRPAEFGLEMHLTLLSNKIDSAKPQMVVIDTISAFDTSASDIMIQRMLQRIVDMMRSREITMVSTSLTRLDQHISHSSMTSISSLMDTWLLLRNVEVPGESNRLISVPKSRGTPNSNQLREFTISDRGINLLDILLDSKGQVVMGSARQVLHNLNKELGTVVQTNMDRQKIALEVRHQILEGKIATLQAEFDAEKMAIEASLEAERIEQMQERFFLRGDSLRRSTSNVGDGDSK
jgi:circadian clock protein KaiC